MQKIKMSSSNNTTTIQPDYTLSYAHGTVMVIAWIMFASTGILIARYGRLLHIGRRVQILGEMVWFQIHRLALSVAALATLLGFFIILAQTKGNWVGVNGGRLFAHSICGIIVVCCALIQIWMALFRCHPDSRFRYIFNWMHRITGLLAFTLSIPTIFLITFFLPNYRSGLVTILSLWSAWVVVIVISFEIIEYQSRRTSILLTNNSRNNPTENAITDTNLPPHVEVYKTENPNLSRFNRMKLFLFCFHLIVAICLAIPLIVLIWLQG
jgi:hypothetical protein